MTQPISRTQNPQQNEALEQERLRRNCNVIRSRIAESFTAMGMGATRSSAYQNTLKSEITTYYQGVGTPVAHKLMQEFLKNGDC